MTQAVLDAVLEVLTGAGVRAVAQYPGLALERDTPVVCVGVRSETVTPPGFGGEIQLTDAMKALAREKGMIAVDFTGKRYDMGSKLGVMQANVEVALGHPEIGEAFREYLRGIAGSI